VKHLVALGLQLWFYSTPIIYPVELVPPAIQPIITLNPMTGIVVSYRAILIDGKLPGNELIYSAIISLLAISIGYWLFKRVEKKFADII
jgi:ABC-type polysaccharide/polyol phosphate export permease